MRPAYVGLCGDCDLRPHTRCGWYAYCMHRHRNVVPEWAQHGTRRDGKTATRLPAASVSDDDAASPVVALMVLAVANWASDKADGGRVVGGHHGAGSLTSGCGKGCVRLAAGGKWHDESSINWPR